MKNESLPMFKGIFILFFLSGINNVFAQEIKSNSNFKPYSGRAGKDVVWVPTSQALVEKMLDIGKVTAKDFLIDLGSGDGRTVISAAKRGAKAKGIEFDPQLIALSKKNAVEQGVSERTEFIEGDFFKADLSKASVITLFLLPSINLRLRPALLDLKPGTRIVSNTFRMGEWDPDETMKAEVGCDNWCEALLWIVPAKVEGSWEMPQGQLKLEQEFQKISGTWKSGKKTFKISDAKLTGTQINFTIDKSKYTGVVDGNKMEGTFVSGQSNTKWYARKQEKFNIIPVTQK